MNHELRMTEDMGRGVFSSRSISKGDVITVCELLVLNSLDTEVVNSTELKYYTFKYTENQDCLVLGCGEIFNHSDTPNVSYRLVSYGDRMLMQFEAIQDIPNGAQLFIDYGADTKVETKGYIENKSLLG